MTASSREAMMNDDRPRPDPDGPLDARVLALVARGAINDAAGEAILEIGPTILRFLRSCLHNETLASDAFSEFSEDLLRGLPAFRGNASLKTWAYRLAWHAVLRVREDGWYRRRHTLVSEAAAAYADQVRTATPIVAQRRALALARIRAQLSLEEQGLLALRVDQALPWEQVAAVMANDGERVAADALMKRFQRLKMKLADIVRRDGLID
jgi:RNA polymerase sigma-70 factor (ECF subfamily)